MFEDLDKIDWKNIHHSHGTAEDFPTWLRTLATGDDKEWEFFEEIEEGLWEEADSAYYYIAELSNHQGSIYEVTPIVLPFIIELLQVVSAKRQVILLHLLQGYAQGSFYGNDPHMRQIVEKQGKNYDEQLSIANSRVIRTRTQLREKLPLFESLHQLSDEEVRQAAEELIDSMNSHPPV